MKINSNLIISPNFYPYSNFPTCHKKVFFWGKEKKNQDLVKFHALYLL